MDITTAPESLESQLLQQTLDQLQFPAVLAFIQSLCSTELGSEETSQLRPAYDVKRLSHEFDMIAEVITILEKDESIPFEGIAEITGLIDKASIANAFLSPTELLRIYDTLRSIRLVRVFARQKEEQCPLLNAHCEDLHENRFLEKHITEAIDDSGTVRDNASKELRRIRTEISDTSAKLRGKLQRILAKLVSENAAMEEFVSQRDGRFVLPVKVEHKRTIPGIIHGVSQTGSTVFLEPSEIFELNNTLSLLRSEEEREVIRILTVITGEVGSEAALIFNSYRAVCYLDTIQARAKYAVKFDCHKPTIGAAEHLSYVNVRHPILAQHATSQTNVIPLSVAFTNGIRGHLISGPNAGGKTVALKSVGLNLLLAQTGIYPMGKCTFHPRRVFSAIGDQQSIEANLSTFSSQIIKLRDILSVASSDALILVDEICSGTDPAEGAALASGMLETFIERKAFFIVTTHQSSLKSFALTQPTIQNDSMEFDSIKMRPTYKFLPGVPGNSYAFELAEMVGLSSTVIARSQKYLGDRHNMVEQSIRALQAMVKESETLHEGAREANSIAVQQKHTYEQKLAELKASRAVLLQEAKDEAAVTLARAQSLIEQTIKEIREQNKSVADIKTEFVEAKKEITKVAEPVIPQKKQADVVQQPIAVGMAVTVEGSAETGIVLELLPNNLATVDFNGIKFKLSVEKLSSARPAPKTQSGNQMFTLSAKSSIDIRGLRADEAVRELDLFLNDAMLGNVPQVTIIHGIGTGALRIAVQTYLATQPFVSEYRDGAQSEGGTGVTFATLS